MSPELSGARFRFRTVFPELASAGFCKSPWTEVKELWMGPKHLSSIPCFSLLGPLDPLGGTASVVELLAVNRMLDKILPHFFFFVGLRLARLVRGQHGGRHEVRACDVFWYYFVLWQC